MKRFFKSVASATAAVAIAAATLAMTTRCTEADEELGHNFIPNHQQMRLRIDTLSSMPNPANPATQLSFIDTYLATNDSVPVSHQGTIFIGQSQDPTFGAIKAKGLIDFFPASSAWNGGKFFGYKPVIDSIFLDLFIADIFGDPTEEQTFVIYALKDSLRRDSVYVRGTDLEQVVDMTTPLFEFKMKDEAKAGTIALLPKLEPTPAGRAFMDKFLEVDSVTYANPWPDFKKHFNGLYIAPKSDSPENAAIYNINLGAGYTNMVLWYHNYDRDKPTEVDTTAFVNFRFVTSGWTGYTYSTVNMSAYDVQFEYPLEMSQHLNDTLPGDTPLETVYVQSLGGVTTYLRFNDNLIEQINSLKNQDGIEYSDIVINQARIYIPIETDGLDTEEMIETMNRAPVRLGMYYTYSQPVWDPSLTAVTAIYGPRPIPDYAYYYENTPTDYYGNGPTAIAYDGYVSRSNAYYRMIITNYITQLLMNPDTTQREVWLGPDVTRRLNTYSQVVLKGSNRDENPIRLVLTYTLVR